MHRRSLVLSLLGLAAVPAQAAEAPAPGPGAFDRATVRRLAQALAAQPYRQPDTRLPAARDNLSYDQFRGIRFKPDQALWRTGNLPFQAQFLPRGFLYHERVEMFEVVDGQARRIAYAADQFTYADPATDVPDDLGFSGFRIHAPLNRADYFDEVCVFQGASYFRAVAKGQVYGLSARGLAIGTADPKGEEFAQFRAFWLERPAPGASALVLHALLDSPSLAGAYRFTLRPGETTVFDVEAALYPRADITEVGIAPLTGMYYFDANDRHGVDDWRPAAHDSEGLSLWTGDGTEIWRPLADPRDLQISVFSDANPRGFGLMQRKRAFADFQDLALDYEKRPSLWIEPIGDTGQGSVMLVEIPTQNEVNDNIIAFWRPKDKLSAKGEYAFTYRMHWGWDCPYPSKLGRVADTRTGGADSGRMFVLDFTGEAMKNLQDASRPHADLGAAPGQIRDVVVEPNPNIQGWRISFRLVPGDARLVELHCALADDQGARTETWAYRWTA